MPELPPGPLYLFDKLVPNLCRSLWGAPAGIKPVEKAELALPSKSTSISYQRAPTVSSDVSETSMLNSPNIPCCLSVLLTSLIKITGGCVALFLALQNHHDDHRAIKRHIAAVSLGILNDEVILDLDYKEDSNAETDLNLVMTDSLELIEIQGTAEEAPFTKDQLNQMLELGSSAIADIIEKQKACLK